MVIKFIYCASQSQGIRNPLGAIPATYPLDEKWRELGQDHPRPVVTIALCILKEFFYGFQLLVRDRYANDVIVFFRFCELLPANPFRPEGGDAYASIVRHDQFCVRVFTVGSVANDAVVPLTLGFVEGHAQLKWFCRLSYPIVLITMHHFQKIQKFYR